MAYVFDPINNTLIDDEDKSLGNKHALNDNEYQKLLDIPGVFRASEAPQPPPRPDVQEIEAINRFIRDNPVEKAEGGRLKAAGPLLFAPAVASKIGTLLGITGVTGLALQRKIQNFVTWKTYKMERARNVYRVFKNIKNKILKSKDIFL